MSAPSRASCSPCATARSGVAWTPPSLKLSGVTLRMPISRGRSKGAVRAVVKEAGQSTRSASCQRLTRGAPGRHAIDLGGAADQPCSDEEGRMWRLWTTRQDARVEILARHTGRPWKFVEDGLRGRAILVRYGRVLRTVIRRSGSRPFRRPRRSRSSGAGAGRAARTAAPATRAGGRAGAARAAR